MQVTANEAMGWLRVARPGSVIGPQQQYLRDNEARMHALGKQGLAGMGLQVRELPKAGCGRIQENLLRQADPSSKSAKLADMVTKGMHSRELLRLGGGSLLGGGSGGATSAASGPTHLPMFTGRESPPLAGRFPLIRPNPIHVAA